MINLWSKLLSFSIIPRKDKKHALRVRRVLYAELGALIHLILCFLIWEEGFFRASTTEFLLIFLVIWVVNLSFLVLVRIGVGQNLEDPSLTLPIMLWGTIFLMLTVYLTLTNELRTTLLMYYLLILTFGIFRLTWRKYLFVTAFGIGLYLIATLCLIHYYPLSIDLKEDRVTLVAFSMISLIFSIMASEMSHFRKSMHGKNVRLTSMLKVVESASFTDELTGVKNRRFILNILEQQILMGERGQYRFSVCMLDLDHFKEVNDKYGHPFGDKVLQIICKIVMGEIRKIDYFARVGGEEFLLVLPLTEAVSAQQSAERIRSKIENTPLETLMPGLKMTVSIGVADYHWPEKIEDILARVDNALYAAKRGGRNLVVSAGLPSPPP